MQRKNFRSEEVAGWLTPSMLDALANAVGSPPDPLALSPLFHMATRRNARGSLTATLEGIAAGLSALGPIDDMPMLPRRVLKDSPAPTQRTRRGRARQLPTHIILRRYERALGFWLDVLAATRQQ
jgi:hypothetical protein